MNNLSGCGQADPTYANRPWRQAPSFPHSSYWKYSVQLRYSHYDWQFLSGSRKRASLIYACEAHRGKFTSLSKVVCSVLKPTEYIGKDTGPNYVVHLQVSLVLYFILKWTSREWERPWRMLPSGGPEMHFWHTFLEPDEQCQLWDLEEWCLLVVQKAWLAWVWTSQPTPKAIPNGKPLGSHMVVWKHSVHPYTPTTIGLWLGGLYR